MQFDRIFDINENWYSQLWLPFAGVLFVVISAGFVIIRRWLGPSWLRFMPIIGAIFGILWTVAATIITVIPYLELSAALRDGRCTITEGVVTQFQPEPPSGHGYESFSVDGKYFKYSKYVLSAGFHQTHLNGSPLREGVHVKIYHVGNDIARLEIARSDMAR
jgi:hypothetical protein